MTNVSIYVAAISAGAGIVGALIPQAVLVIREVRQAGKDRRERFTTATRDACVDLLRTAGEVQTLVENIPTYRGGPDGMRSLVAEIVTHAGATRVHAANVSLLAPSRLAESADEVTASARKLAEAVVENTNMDQGVPIGVASTSALDVTINGFRDAAVKFIREVI